MMTPYNRHDLLWLSQAGRDFAFNNILSCIPAVYDKQIDEKQIRAIILGEPQIPAIVRRQEASVEKGLLSIGYSSTTIIDGVRLRIGCKTPINCITRRMSPFDVVNDAIKCEKKLQPDLIILKALVEAGNHSGILVGCFGSAALQLVTGLPYWRENSDLDIYLQSKGTRQELEMFFNELLKIEDQFDITIDAEIEFPHFYGVKLKELFSAGKYVLGKGLNDVALLNVAL
jgi:phosphoribosyl-dephospho-CoA transferase